MKERFIVNSEENRMKAQAAMECLGIEQPHEVIIRPVEKSRSAAQNSLYWMWVTEISNSTGETKDDVHARCKHKFLLRLFERDDPQGYGQMIAAVRDVSKLGLSLQAKALGHEIVRLTSTTHATVKQFTEYLEDMEKFHIAKGIALSHPQDQYLEAMGR